MNYLNSKFDFLKPIKIESLKRVGVKKDGGYIVDYNIVLNTDYLLSFGMGTDWSFESEYIRLNKKGVVHIYDYSINFYTFLRPFFKYLKRFLTFRLSYKDLLIRFNFFKEYIKFINCKNVNFFKEKISKNIEKNIKTTSTDEAFDRLEKINKIIMKIDIEGSEYEVFEEVIKNYNKIEMLIIEFHEIDKHEIQFEYIVKKLKKYFDIVHLHGNNHCGLAKSGIPKALEITMISNKYKPTKINYEKNFPNKYLDYPNDPCKNDLFFNFK